MTSRRTWPMWLFRIVVTVHLVLLCLQPFSAGAFLSGMFPMITMHTAVGGTVWMVSLIQVVSAILLWWPAKISPWPLPLSAALVVAELVQLVAGIERVMWLHLPLGTFLIVAMVWLVGWAYRTPAASPARGPAAPADDVQVGEATT